MSHSSDEATPLRVTYLLAVWGENYIQQFLEVSLPSLLAEGNIPALARATSSRFIFLTRRSDQPVFNSYPAFAALQKICDIEFVDIDDIIYGCNYSATLTIAYERGMRQMGDAMCSTYFIYLVADYIMANGSLANLLPYMQRGVSGITSGNFQVIEEEVKAKILAHKDANNRLAIDARSLLALSLPHLHPVTEANIINAGNTHTSHTNRLFWRMDEHTLIGRFYLRHMLAIKPEIDNYIIGASCDYAFIPEMCPSGNVVHISDSDEFCVIEMQPHAHELSLVKQRVLQAKNLITSLADWATNIHRTNILQPIVFHAKELPDNTQKMVEESAQFVEGIEAQLPVSAKPVRGHAYWTSCLDTILERLILPYGQRHHLNITSRLRGNVCAGIVGSPVFEPPMPEHGDYLWLKVNRFRHQTSWRFRLILAIRRFILDIANAPIYHPHYRIKRRIMREFPAINRPTLFIADIPSGFAEYCRTPHTHYQQLDVFLARDAKLIQEVEQIIILSNDAEKKEAAFAKCEPCPHIYFFSTKLPNTSLHRFYARQVHSIFQPKSDIDTLPRLMAILKLALVCVIFGGCNILTSGARFSSFPRKRESSFYSR